MNLYNYEWCGYTAYPATNSPVIPSLGITKPAIHVHSMWVDTYHCCTPVEKKQPRKVGELKLCIMMFSAFNIAVGGCSTLDNCKANDFKFKIGTYKACSTYIHCAISQM